MARDAYAQLKDTDIEIASFNSSVKKTIPPKLFELTGLQAEMSKSFKVNPMASMEIAQKNYDNPVSIQVYPRTDTPYLKSGEYADVKIILRRLSDHGIIDNQIIADILSRTIPKRNSTFNDKEVTAHGAIIPTKAGDYKKWTESLPGLNKKMFELISKRYVANFMKDYAYKNISGESNIINDNLKITFSENIPVEAGWKAIYDNNIKKDIETSKQVIPDMKSGDFIKLLSFSDTKSETKPKPPFTMATLLLAMENISSLFPDNPEIKKHLGESGIGTSATRSKIIEEVMDKDKNAGEPWIMEVGSKIKSTDKAKNFVRALPPELVSPIKRAILNKRLKEIERGSLSYDELAEEYLSATKRNIELIKEIVKTQGFIKGAEKGNTANLTVIGKCPLCEGSIVEKKKIFSCTNAKYKKIGEKITNEGCKFMIFKGALAKYGKNNIPATEAKKVLDGKRVQVSFKSQKNGTSYNKLIELDLDWGVKVLWNEDIRK